MRFGVGFLCPISLIDMISEPSSVTTSNHKLQTSNSSRLANIKASAALHLSPDLINVFIELKIGYQHIMVGIFFYDPVELLCGKMAGGKNIIDAKGRGDVGKGFAHTQSAIQKTVFKVLATDGEIGVGIRNVIEVARENIGPG